MYQQQCATNDPIVQLTLDLFRGWDFENSLIKNFVYDTRYPREWLSKMKASFIRFGCPSRGGNVAIPILTTFPVNARGQYMTRTILPALSIDTDHCVRTLMPRYIDFALKNLFRFAFMGFYAVWNCIVLLVYMGAIRALAAFGSKWRCIFAHFAVQKVLDRLVRLSYWYIEKQG